jgi:rubrerythrin
MECPYLSKPAKIVYKGFNDLQTRKPDIAKQWHPIKNGEKRPSDVLPNATYRAWWLCDVCGNEWVTAVYNRTNGKGCTVCARRISANKRKTKG